jgi:protein tyrosine phosphatase
MSKIKPKRFVVEVFIKRPFDKKFFYHDDIEDDSEAKIMHEFQEALKRYSNRLPYNDVKYKLVLSELRGKDYVDLRVVQIGSVALVKDPPKVLG